VSPRERIRLVAAIAILFLASAGTATYCLVSYFQGIDLNAQAFQELRAEHFDKAIPLYTAASHKLLDSTTRALVYGNRGWCYTKEEMDDEAIRDFTVSIQLDPRPVYSVLDRGLAYYRKCKFENAAADLTVALEKDPNRADAYNYRARIFMLKGEFGRAIADYSEAIRCDPANAQLFVDRGMAYAADGQLDPAIASFDSALTHNPTHAGAFIQRAAAYGRKGNWEKGVVDVSAAIGKIPKAAQLHYARAFIYLDRGIIDKALPDIAEALRLSPNYDLAFLLQSRAAVQDRNWPEALRNADKALELNPRLAAALYLRGRALTAQARYDEAIAAFDRTLHIDPTFDWALYFRAQNYAYRHEYSSALEQFREIATNLPKAEVAHVGFGWFLATCAHDAYRDGQEAVTEARMGCEISHWENWYALDVLGAAYAEAGDFEQAKKFATEALSRHGLSPKDRALVEARLARYSFNIAIRDIGGAEIVPTLFEEAVNAYAHENFDRTIQCLNLVLPPNPGGSVSAALFHLFDGTHTEKNHAPWSPIETTEITNGFYYRGLAHAKRREWDKAIADLSTVLWREPGSSAALAERGLCHQQQGDLESALGDFDEMIRRNRADARGSALRAEVLRIKGESHAALELATAAADVDPKLALPHDVLGRIYAAEQKLQLADREFGEADRLDPDQIRDALASAHLFVRQRDYRRAEAEFRQVALLFPRSGHAQNALAWFLATTPDRSCRNGSEAIERATAACDFSQWTDAGYIDTLAAAYAETGDFEQAIKRQTEALAKAEPDAQDRKELEKHLIAFKRREPWRGL
jgi:tetratricopeptide (TPR) repeat protein